MHKNDADYFNEEVLDRLEVEFMTYLRSKDDRRFPMEFQVISTYRIPAYFLILWRREYQCKQTTIEHIAPVTKRAESNRRHVRITLIEYISCAGTQRVSKKRGRRYTEKKTKKEAREDRKQKESLVLICHSNSFSFYKHGIRVESFPHVAVASL
jgi:hypothetical protein